MVSPGLVTAQVVMWGTAEEHDLAYTLVSEAIMDSQRNKPEQPHEEVAAHVAGAHDLLQRLREKVDKHPELEEAIRRLEMALSLLTVNTGGML